MITSNNNNEEDRVFEALLDYLRTMRGFDFSGYKRPSLERRIRKQMQLRNIDNYGDYLDYLEVHPEEFNVLFNTILINVTAFFRDADAWNYLQEHTIPHLLRDKPKEELIRVWSAGCASGEEAYTVAIIFAEVLGLEQFRQRVKIYATDVDEEALVQARQAIYDARSLELMPTALKQRYFEPMGDRYAFRSDMRRVVIFGRNDLVQDAPISRLDLLICRNTLMYFNAETQAKILARFHFALNKTGALFLGKAEMLLTHAHLFTPLNLQHRIFSKVPKINLRDRLLVFAQTGDEEASNRLVDRVRLREAAFNSVPQAQLVVDWNGNLALANPSARSMFNITLQSLGRPLQDLDISYRPLDLRSAIDKVYSDRTSISVIDVIHHLPDGSIKYLDVHIALLQDDASPPLGVSITFIDVTRYHELQVELQRSNQELETANEELQSSNEELETTNEELQSTNEELETTNEELQSTNEEMETMNEELQSTNEELQTINDELRMRTHDLNQANSSLNSILASIQAGVIAINSQLNVLIWNHEAENLWGLRSEEVEGQSLFSLDINLPLEQLREPIRACLNGDQERYETLIRANNRRGKSIRCQLNFNPLFDVERVRQGVIILIKELQE